jgi:hypothetical protein
MVKPGPCCESLRFLKFLAKFLKSGNGLSIVVLTTDLLTLTNSMKIPGYCPSHNCDSYYLSFAAQDVPATIRTRAFTGMVHAST